jgi:hypothetical protein
MERLSHKQADQPVTPIVSAFSGWKGYIGAIMRTLAILLATLAITLSPPAALAKTDKTPPGQVDEADKPDPPGQAKPDKPDPPGQVKNGDKPEPPGHVKHDEPPGQVKKGGDAPNLTPPGTANDEIDEAQRAVERHEALPLAKIISIAEAGTTGRVINARLVRIDSTLLYQLTFLDDAGLSWRAYYYARSGNPVNIP